MRQGRSDAQYKMVTVEILSDSFAPAIFAVSINDLRITPIKGSGSWEVVRRWTIDPRQILKAMIASVPEKLARSLRGRTRGW